jgi:alpha/beta hydrolase family protein
MYLGDHAPTLIVVQMNGRRPQVNRGQPLSPGGRLLTAHRRAGRPRKGRRDEGRGRECGITGRLMAMLAVMIATSVLVAPGVRADSAGGQPRFRVISSHAVAASYIDTDGLLSNSFIREDGSLATYEAPVRLLYATKRSSCGGIGFEDLANGFAFNFPNLHDDFWNLHFGRRVLTDAFLAKRGVFYASPTWDKKAIDSMGRGHLDRRADGERVIDDVAAWLRDSSSVVVVGAPSGFVGPTCAATTVLGYGASDSASLLRMLFARGNPGRTFDGGIIHSAGATCWNFTVGQASDSCPTLPPNLNAKVISIDTETDMDIQDGVHARQDGLSEYRHYELAGSAHLTKAEADLMEFARQAEDEDPALAIAVREAAHHQNPESAGPALRAAFDSLTRWVRQQAAPPQNAYLDGRFDLLGTFTIERDADGNALGGIRLPWLTTVVANGSTVGAAVGTHSGVDPLGGFILGGHYECFEDVHTRYPTQQAYEDKVAAGARFAESRGWILKQDRLQYERQAASLDLSHIPCPPWPEG